uniref:Sulfatase domain-containing protein n=1 Tax=Strongyloides papillosus TaxID=174720 RepID=A0A0N5BBP4_STREA
MTFYKNIDEVKKFRKLLNDSTFTEEACTFDIQDPFHKTILKYIKKEKPIYCGEKNYYENIIVVKGNRISISPNDTGSFKCSGRNFKFKAGGKDDENEYGEWRSFSDEGFFEMESDFANVVCYKKSLFNIEVKVYEKSIGTGVVGNLEDFGEEKDDEPSVIMIGIDSLSRSNFIRSLPKTYKFLNDNGFVNFKRHVKVADNTYGNWIAILTGLRGAWSLDLPVELTDSWNMWFDDFPLVWKNFTSYKYATLFAEDRSDIATFNYLGKLYGFKKQPTTHYFRPFWLDVTGTMKYKQSKFGCYGSDPNTKIQFDYLSSFLENYKSKKKFAWWWSTEMSHDYLNSISSMDDIYLNFFTNNLNKMINSIIIVFSDHGNRYDTIRETDVGRHETRLPFLSVHLPKKLKNTYPFLEEVMIENSEKMTTQYDIHETLMSVLKKEWRRDVTERRAYSLFHQHPRIRKCKASGIPANYCPCNKEIRLPIEESIEASTFLIEYLNNKLTNFQNFIKSDKKYRCRTLQLDKILYASLIIPSDVITLDEQHLGSDIISNHLSVVYRLMVRMKGPSNALIEAMIEKNISTKKYLIKDEIERNNKYGNTSFCVNDAQIQKICHCYEV